MGRPEGSKNKDIGDLNPTIRKLFAKALSSRKRRKAIEEYLDTLPPSELVDTLMAMSRIASNASPRGGEIGGGGMSVNLYVNGVKHQGVPIGKQHGEVVDISPRALPSPQTVNWSEGLPGGKAEKCPALCDLPPKKAPVPDPAPLPPGTQIFRVPRFEDVSVPAEWRGNLFEEE